MRMKFSTLFILLACVSGALGQPNSSFYVATTGNDSNPGTQAAPWRTIQHAADSAQAGSTVNVRGGIYEELVSINVSGNATDGFITLRSYPGEMAVLEAAHLTPTDEWRVVLHGQGSAFGGRLCALRKSDGAIQQAHRRLQRKVHSSLLDVVLHE
jgi:hypothetical protein